MNLLGNDTFIPSNEKCPKCGSTDTAYDVSVVLASNPSKYCFKCNNCHHNWTDIFNSNLDTITPQPKLIETKDGTYGWICPVCGAGIAPYQDHCPLCAGRNSLQTWTYGTDTALSYKGEFRSEIKGEHNENK